MSVPTCTRRIAWCSGHRVLGHEGKCRHAHGHNYEAEITARGSSLDGIGRVVDFSVLKGVIGAWVETEWDHGFLAFEQDKEAIAAMRQIEQQKLALLPANPTAENIAAYLLAKGNELLAAAGHAVEVVRVRVHETPNCYADAGC